MSDEMDVDSPRGTKRKADEVEADPTKPRRIQVRLPFSRVLADKEGLLANVWGLCHRLWTRMWSTRLPPGRSLLRLFTR